MLSCRAMVIGIVGGGPKNRDTEHIQWAVRHSLIRLRQPTNVRECHRYCSKGLRAPGWWVGPDFWVSAWDGGADCCRWQ